MNIDKVSELNEEFNRCTIASSFTYTDNTVKNINEFSIEISQEKIDKAKKWSADSNIFTMYPTNDPDDLYDKFSSQHRDLQRLANWFSTELFGMDNDQMYEMLKNKQIKYPDMDKLNDMESLNKSMEDLDNIQPVSFTEAVEINNAKKKILNKIKSINEQSKFKWEFMYAPYLSPKEIFELEGFYSDTVEDSSNEIFKEYVNYCYGYENNFDILKWDNEVRRLMYKLEYAKTIDDKNSIKQSLIKVGWNPEIKYTNENKIKSKNRLENIFNEMYKNVSVLNIESQLNSFNESDVIHEAKNKKLHPISIVLVRGNSKFSDLIVKVTKGPFSHSAICIDDDFERLYSFNGHHYSNTDGGFSLESIRTYPKDNRVAVFSFFVNSEQYDKINNAIQQLLYYINKTTYSIVNVITLPFKNININRDESLICSQFVDKILKLADIDITKKDSSKVTPNYLYDISISNSKIYKIYDGAVKDFDNIKASKFLNSFAKKAKPIKESNIYEYFTKTQYEYPVVSEGRKLPLEVKDNGDVLLTNPMVDYNAEYFNSHKLLLQYDKVNNIDGMKYELARLYFMNYKLEKKIYSNKFKSKRDENIKTRARILNDFNKYLNKILKNDPSFNFAKYYEDSIFYANTVEIKNSTLKSIKDIISYIL